MDQGKISRVVGVQFGQNAFSLLEKPAFSLRLGLSFLGMPHHSTNLLLHRTHMNIDGVNFSVLKILHRYGDEFYFLYTTYDEMNSSVSISFPVACFQCNKQVIYLAVVIIQYILSYLSIISGSSGITASPSAIHLAVAESQVVF